MAELRPQEAKHLQSPGARVPAAPVLRATLQYSGIITTRSVVSTVAQRSAPGTQNALKVTKHRQTETSRGSFRCERRVLPGDAPAPTTCWFRRRQKRGAPRGSGVGGRALPLSRNVDADGWSQRQLVCREGPRHLRAPHI